MRKLLRFEFRKAFTTRAFYVILALSITMAIVTLRTYYSRGISSVEYDGLVSLARAFDNSNLAMFFGIFTAIFVCDDYTNGTIRNIVTRGYSRTMIYFSKLIVVCSVCVFILIICWIVSGITGWLQWESGTRVINLGFIKSMAAQFMITLAFVCLFNAISSALQKTGSSIAVCLVIPFVMTLLLSFAELNLGGNGESVFGDFMLQQYWLGDMVSAIGYVTPDKDSLHLVFTATPIYIVVTTLLGWAAMLKREF